MSDDIARIADALERIAEIAEDAINLDLLLAARGSLGQAQFDRSIGLLVDRASERRRSTADGGGRT